MHTKQLKINIKPENQFIACTLQACIWPGRGTASLEANSENQLKGYQSCLPSKHTAYPAKLTPLSFPFNGQCGIPKGTLTSFEIPKNETQLA